MNEEPVARPMEHPDAETIRRFACVAATRDENRIIVRHLLRGCPECAIELTRSWLSPLTVDPCAYDKALDRCLPLLGNILLKQ